MFCNWNALFLGIYFMIDLPLPICVMILTSQNINIFHINFINQTLFLMDSTAPKSSSHCLFSYVAIAVS